jgi:hypothetical protein
MSLPVVQAVTNWGTGEVAGANMIDEQGQRTFIPQTPPTNTAPAGSGGGAARPVVNTDDLAYLDDQAAALRRLLGDIATTRDQGFARIGDDYSREEGGINQSKARATEGFQVKREDNTKGKLGSYNKVDTNARTLNDSVRRLLGMASGSQSSAFQEAAPNAVARDASIKRTDVTDTFGRNDRDINTAEEDTNLEFESALSDLLRQRRQKESDLETGVIGQEREVNENLANIAGERAKVAGGGYNSVKAAQAPYQAVIDSKRAALAGLFDKYRTPFQAKAVEVKAPNLAEFTVDRTAVNAGNQGGTADYNPYAAFLQKKREATA